MKYAYTDVSNVEIKMSLTPWEINKLREWLWQPEEELEYAREKMIEVLTEALEKAGSSLAYEAEHVKGYAKNNVEIVENNNA